MFKSWQQDYPQDSKDWEGTININSNNILKENLLYYKGENVICNNLKRLYYSDKDKAIKLNPYVANNKIAYGFFGDCVNQKVNTLLNENISVDGLDNDILIKKLSYALKECAKKTSIYGYNFLYVGDNDFKVFDASKCIAYIDDETSQLMALVKYWYVKSKLYYEVYDENGINGKPYKYRIKKSAISTEYETIPTKMPIFIMKNNEEMTSDLTNNIKSKIDIIDIVQSGFANNIEDFSEVFMVLKTTNPDLDSDYYEDFIANVNKTHKIMGDEVDVKQFTIPVEARSKFVDIMKQDLYDESGVIDYKALTGGSLTNVAIKSATLKLMQRVSDFEWFVYNMTLEILAYLGYENLDVTFNKLIIDNETELVDNAIKVKGSISQRSYLTLLKRANLINNVDNEIKALQEDNKERFVIDDGEEANGYNIGTIGENNQTGIHQSLQDNQGTNQ